MNFEWNKSIDILRRTPDVLDSLLKDISEDWSMKNEGPDTFSPFDVVGHLLHGEKTDWIPRMEIILGSTDRKVFEPYDRFAQYTESRGKTMNQLLSEFRDIRQENVQRVKEKKLAPDDLLRTGMHPKLGMVTLQQLLATWTIHDLSHIAQITRVMCKQYREDVGPWIEYMPVLTRY